MQRYDQHDYSLLIVPNSSHLFVAIHHVYVVRVEEVEDEEFQSDRASGRDTSRSQIISDEVAEAIEALSTKRKMIETVQIECSLAPRHGIAGLQSVSL